MLLSQVLSNRHPSTIKMFEGQPRKFVEISKLNRIQIFKLKISETNFDQKLRNFYLLLHKDISIF